MKIVNTNEKIEMAKRFYVPAQIYDCCPECKNETKFDWPYLMYPIANDTTTLTFQCDDCDLEWYKDIIIRIVVEEVK